MNKAAAAIAAFFCCVMLASSPSNGNSARFLEGNLLREMCTSDQKAQSAFFDEGFCLGFVSGVTSFITSSKDAFPDRWPNTCIPDSVPMGQRRDVFVKYLDDHPEELHFLADLLVLLAMRDAFPCARN